MFVVRPGQSSSGCGGSIAGIDLLVLFLDLFAHSLFNLYCFFVYVFRYRKRK